jgi:mRNA interferase RelE/StbE
VAKYSLFIKPSAVKEIESIGTKKDRQRIVTQIKALSDDPRPFGYKKLSGKEKYRIRCGVYRILYIIEDNKLTVVVVKVGHRKDVYNS